MAKLFSKKQKNQNGYIALMTAIIICLILVGLALLLSASGYFTRFNVLGGEDKRVSLGLAESCVNVALLKIAKSPDYQAGADSDYVSGQGVRVHVGAQECFIKDVTPRDADDKRTIKTQAQFRGAFSNMEITATVLGSLAGTATQATLTVVTHVINNNGGVKQASDFTINVSGTASPSSSPGAEGGGTVFTLDAGSGYAVSVFSPAGYIVSSSGDCSGSVNAGDSKTCAITADDIATTATLTLVANVTNNNGGTKLPGDFNLYINGAKKQSGAAVTLAPGSYTASADAMTSYSASVWGFDCAGSGAVTLNAGDNKTCVIDFDDDPPAAPNCADTMMVLDRTGSMTGTDLANEQAAAKALLNLYKPLSPAPQVGVARFNADTGDGDSRIAIGLPSDTGYVSPTLQTADTGGTGNNGFETTPTAAFADGGSSAINNNGIGDRHQYYGYNMAFPPDAVITGVEVRLDWRIDVVGGASVSAFLSWDGGATWTTALHRATGGATTEQTRILGGNTDNWEHSWTVADLDPAKFRVRVQTDSTSSPKIFYLDWIPVRVYYQRPIGYLTNVYGDDDAGADTDGDLFEAVERSTIGGAGYTNIGEAITIADNELNSARHLAGLEKVMILISDGDPNRPTTADPVKYALDAADAAKINGVKIFTIHFGSDPAGFKGRDLLAALASGSFNVPVSMYNDGTVHQPGSANDKSTAAQENTDGDNFFISPTSADMQGIFETIGKIACPAAGGALPPPPPTTATLIVSLQVVNDNGGLKQAADFTVNVTALNPSQSSFAGASAPGVSVTVGPNNYSVDESIMPGYNKILGAECSGTIATGQTKTCTILNDDIPPAPPAPPPAPPLPPSVSVDTWEEKPNL